MSGHFDTAYIKGIRFRFSSIGWCKKFLSLSISFHQGIKQEVLASHENLEFNTVNICREKKKK